MASTGWGLAGAPGARGGAAARGWGVVWGGAAAAAAAAAAGTGARGRRRGGAGAPRAASLQGSLADLFGRAVQEAFPEAGPAPAAGGEVGAAVAACADPSNGDYQCNEAMPLFGRLKKAGGDLPPGGPRGVAEGILAALPESGIVAETSVAGPGFINVRVCPEFLARRVEDAARGGGGGGGARLPPSWAPDPPCGRAVVDFSSPNVAKEMHVGHLRSTVIGDALCRCLEFSGVSVLRLNHVGDWGTQFGMLIQHMAEGGGGGGEDRGAGAQEVSNLMRLYREAKVRFDEDAAFKTRAQEAVVTLQAGDPNSVQRWEAICQASRVEFQALYDALGVRLQERGESFYNPLLAPLVDDLVHSGVAEVSDGATCVFVEGDDVPLIVKKSDGGFGYGTTDMAALRQRLEEEKADWIIYVTDQGQSGHFDKVFKAARKAGWIKGEGDGARIEHVAFGLVLGEDGKRLRTRSGDVVRLADLLAEAVSRCRAQLQERAPDMAPEEVDRAAKAMGHAAVKYADLRQNRQTDYTFSFDRMTDLKGDTAVYLLYAYARVASILRKAGPEAVPAGGTVRLEHEAEQRLALQLAQFPEAVEAVLSDLAPNRLCAYVMALSTAFTEFYSQCQVLGAEQEASRLALCQATRNVMGQCFDLLGMEPLERI